MASWSIPSNSAAVIHIDRGAGGGLYLQCLDPLFQEQEYRTDQQSAEGRSASDCRDIPYSCDQRSGSGGSHLHGPTPALETSCEDVDRHAHPTGNQSPPQDRRSIAQIKKFRRYHRSPLYQVADALKNFEMETLETINPFTLAPWEERVQGDGQNVPEAQTETGGVMRIAVSSSARNDMVGFGVAIEKQPPRYRKPRLKIFSVTLGARTEQNPYSGELAAMAYVMNTLRGLKRCRATMLTSNKAAELTLKNPRQQSGQEHICQIYKLIRRLRGHDIEIRIRWVPRSENN